MRPHLQCERKAKMSTPSVMRAEFAGERAKANEFRNKVNAAIREEDAKQKRKIDKMKAKYDREGVQYVSDESEIGKEDGKKPQSASNLGPQPGDPLPHATTSRGHPSTRPTYEEKNTNFGGNTM